MVGWSSEASERRIVKAFAVLLIIVGVLLVQDELQKNNLALEFLKKHWVPNDKFFSLTPDLKSAAWSVRSNFFGCPLRDYRCADVHYSFSVMQGANVKRVECVWRVQISKGKVTKVEAGNPEARELFMDVQGSVSAQTPR